MIPSDTLFIKVKDHDPQQNVHRIFRNVQIPRISLKYHNSSAIFSHSVVRIKKVLKAARLLFTSIKERESSRYLLLSCHSDEPHYSLITLSVSLAAPPPRRYESVAATLLCIWKGFNALNLVQSILLYCIFYLSLSLSKNHTEKRELSAATRGEKSLTESVAEFDANT
jgi:hypothetical protein